MIKMTTRPTIQRHRHPAALSAPPVEGTVTGEKGGGGGCAWSGWSRARRRRHSRLWSWPGSERPRANPIHALRSASISSLARGKTILWLFGERLEDDGFDCFGQVGNIPARRDRIFANVL